MELRQKVKTGLDESRILVLGAQILLGFQFRSVFQTGYGELGVAPRALDAVALLLISAAVALLVAPALYHRLIAGGEDTREIHALITMMAAWSLLPFALSFGIDVFIGVGQIAGSWPGAAAGAAVAALALFWWYGLGVWRRKSAGIRERTMAESRAEERGETPLHTKIEQLLTEARVILPGAQALLGFQLAIILTKSFTALPPSSKAVHGVALGLIAVAVILLMAPAAYHRIVYAGEDAAEFHRTAGTMVTAATAPLALAISGDVFVVITAIAHTAIIGVVAAALVFSLFAALWYVYPLLRRLHLTARAAAE